MLALVAPRQLQILVRSLLCLLDESMQQDHPALLVDVEEHPRYSVLGQARPHLVDAIAYRSANGHADWPAELDGLNVLADPLPVLG
jgi:hypothetical protein